jgi:hypothetical protein
VTPTTPDPFAEFVAELSDGQRWSLLRAEGWDDFIQRLSDLIAALPARRRQALIMLLFALVYEQLTPDNAKVWLEDHEVDSDDGIETMISWLRQFRPPLPPPNLAG